MRTPRKHPAVFVGDLSWTLSLTQALTHLTEDVPCTLHLTATKYDDGIMEKRLPPDAQGLKEMPDT